MFKKAFFWIYHLILPLILIGFLWHSYRLSKLEYKSVGFTTSLIFLRNTEELARLNFFLAKHNFYLTTALDMGIHYINLTKEQKASVLDKKWNNFLESLPDVTKDDKTYIAREIIYEDMSIHREAKNINRRLNLIKNHPSVFPHVHKLIFRKKQEKAKK